MELKLNKIDAAVYEIIKEKKNINLDDLIISLNPLNEDSIRRSLEVLKREGLIDEK
jgi:predicted transcriptional regulator